jgi:hypothetical protein
MVCKAGEQLHGCAWWSVVSFARSFVCLLVRVLGVASHFL